MPLMPLKSARRDLRSAPNNVLLEDEFSAPIDELLTRILALAPIKLERALVWSTLLFWRIKVPMGELPTSLPCSLS